MSSLSAISQLAIREWILMLGLIFGGCCSSVFTLEKVISKVPASGTILTFVQFLFIAGEGYITFFDRSRPPFFIKKNQVPYKRWVWTIIMFFLVSTLNNVAFGFNISMPVHIIFRSSGTPIVMIIGFLFAGKKYNKLQVLSAILLTIGAILATLYKDTEIILFKRDELEDITGENIFSFSEQLKYATGVILLFIVVVLMAVMGLYNEETYRRYGKHWQENVFYSHLFGIPIFFLIWPKVYSEFMDLWNYPEYFHILGFEVPKQMVYLILNVLTQYVCIRGVNMLAGNTTALTLSVVLLLRKFTSLIISMILFNNSLSFTGGFGATLVFAGALLYSYGSTQKKATEPILVVNKEIPLNDLSVKEN